MTSVVELFGPDGTRSDSSSSSGGSGSRRRRRRSRSSSSAGTCSSGTVGGSVPSSGSDLDDSVFRTDQFDQIGRRAGRQRKSGSISIAGLVTS